MTKPEPLGAGCSYFIISSLDHFITSLHVEAGVFPGHNPYMLIHGRCHCGNISFSLTWEPDPSEIPARACTCSFCQKHGGVWTSNPVGTLKIAIVDQRSLSKYQFGTRTAEFHLCVRCGVLPIVTSRVDDHVYAVVNVNTFENVEPSRLRRSEMSFESEDLGSRLARRKENWIGDVRYE